MHLVYFFRCLIFHFSWDKGVSNKFLWKGVFVSIKLDILHRIDNFVMFDNLSLECGAYRIDKTIAFEYNFDLYISKVYYQLELGS